MAHTLLLRSPTRNPVDKYEAILQTHGYLPVSIPVLETTLVNLDALVEIVKTGPETNNLDGVIITSARSCEAWSEAVDRLIGEESADITAGSWRTVNFYVVGEATATVLEDIGRKSSHTRYAPSPQNIRGRDSAGTSEKLAHYILDDLKTKRDAVSGTSPQKKLLYLTGDKNRDTLPNILHEGGVGLQSLQVYGTHGSSTFEKDLDLILKESSDGSRPWWLVYFAPSAASFVTPILEEHFALRGSGDATSVPPLPSGSSRSKKWSAKIAAIGPTTATFLNDTLGLDTHATAAKPTPESLFDAINAYDRN